jgi:hypothetical protein
MFNKEEDYEGRMILADKLLDECFIDPAEEIEHPPVAISYGTHSYTTKDGEVTYDTPFGTYGNFSVISAPPKHKKTFLVTLLSAAYLGGNSKRFVGKIKGNRSDKCLMHFDTEQGAFHAQRVFRRVLDMCDLKNECYKTYGLRALTPKERLDVIDLAIQTTGNLGVVIIDGLADLVNDVNNIEEANNVVQKVMTWTQKYDIHIITVIHNNHGSSKPTGHLGSAMEKKAETIALLEKDNFNSDIVRVKCKSSRSRSFEDFNFYVNKYGYPEVASVEDKWIDEFLNENRPKDTN